MGESIRTKTNATTKRDGDDATLRRLESLAELCVSKGIQKLEVDNLKLEFHPSAFVRPVDAKTFESAVKQFEMKASANHDAQKEYEQTLFWSA